MLLGIFRVQVSSLESRILAQCLILDARCALGEDNLHELLWKWRFRKQNLKISGPASTLEARVFLRSQNQKTVRLSPESVPEDLQLH